MKKAIATGIILSMLLSPLPAYANIDDTIIKYENMLKDKVKQEFRELPAGVKMAVIGGGAIFIYGAMSKPQVLKNIIIAGAKSQKSYTATQHRAWVKLVRTGKPTIPMAPKAKIKPDNRAYTDKLGDLFK